MTTYSRHKYELLHLELKITDHSMQKAIWEEIQDRNSIKMYQDLINSLELQKEHYLNNLLISLGKTEITETNIEEIKSCYELIEQYSKKHYSSLFKSHVNRTVEDYQKKYGDFLIRNQLRKATEIEKIILGLESKV